MKLQPDKRAHIMVPRANLKASRLKSTRLVERRTSGARKMSYAMLIGATYREMYAQYQFLKRTIF